MGTFIRIRGATCDVALSEHTGGGLSVSVPNPLLKTFSVRDRYIPIDGEGPPLIIEGIINSRVITTFGTVSDLYEWMIDK